MTVALFKVEHHLHQVPVALQCVLGCWQLATCLARYFITLYLLVTETMGDCNQYGTQVKETDIMNKAPINLSQDQLHITLFAVLLLWSMKIKQIKKLCNWQPIFMTNLWGGSVSVHLTNLMYRTVVFILKFNDFYFPQTILHYISIQMKKQFHLSDMKIKVQGHKQMKKKNTY